ncbi:MAG: ankyrin repeat domain-containing protein [Spirochaetia bacterium]|nr:ankyrin repeat domain-containing protein [Spirochaetia bacterium]
MNIAVTALAHNADLASQLIHTLAEGGMRAYGVKYGSSWRHEAKAKTDGVLSKATHFLHIVDPRTEGEGFLAYVVGMARGDGRHMAVYRADALWEARGWLAGLPVFDGSDETLAFYRAERQEWQVAEQRRQARASLLELGISWHAESMAQCAREGDNKAIELFLASGYPPDVRDKTGVPMLCLAARSRHHTIVELLLDRGCDINVQSDDRGYSALMDAAQTGDDALLRILLGRGANPDLASKDGQTALILAVGRNDLVSAKLLLEHGANADLTDKLGLSARKYASLFHNPDMAALFADYP